MGKYQQDAEKLLQEIGGKENIAAVTHCATRMRFVLNDESKANEKAIENIPSVKGMFTNAGHFRSLSETMSPHFITILRQYRELKGFPKNRVRQLPNKIKT